MSIDKEIGYNGATVFWSLKNGTSREKLKEGFESIGRPELLPSVENDGPALRRAIRNCFPSRGDSLIRPLKGVAGFAVIEEREETDPSGQVELTHRQELCIAISGTTTLANPPDHVLVDRIKEEYLKEKQKIPASKLGSVLVDACKGLSGIPLRPRGGMYWLPEDVLGKWEEVVSVVEAADSGNRCWRMKTTTDQETVDAVCDSLVIEVEKQLEGVMEALTSEESILGKRALKTKSNTALELKELVAQYEGILSRTLSDLSEKADGVQSAVGLALLQAI
tara:strand:- start:13 stop:849 length:837 start_codon:yes stop_codon:yes gene_type:complete